MYKRGFIIFGVVSLTMGNSPLPLADRFIRDKQHLGQVALGQPALPPQLGQKPPEAALIQLMYRCHLCNLLSIRWLNCTCVVRNTQPTGSRIIVSTSFFRIFSFISGIRKPPRKILEGFCSSRRLPIFTRRFQRTILGTSELNFCVRNGNRWNLTVIVTDHMTGSVSHTVYCLSSVS